jgi:hypothetical protein
MSELGKLEHEGEDYAQQHPEQVKEGESAVEKKLGLDQQNSDQQNNGQQDGNRQDNAQRGDSQPGGAGDGQN